MPLPFNAIPFTTYWPSAFGSGSSTQNLNASGTWNGLSIVGTGKTLNAVRVLISGVTGSPIAANITCSLQLDDGAGAPDGTSIQTTTIDSIATGFRTFSGFSTALTDGRRYWLVFKNLNGTPASNFVTMQTLGSGPSGMGGTSTHGWVRKLTTNSGSSWASVTDYSGIRLAFSDSTFEGLAITVNVAGAVGEGIYADREIGTIFRLADGMPSPRVVGVTMGFSSRTGSPTGLIRARLYSGSSPTLLATGVSVDPQLQTTGSAQLPFASVQVLTPGVEYRVTLSETTNSDASGNRYNARIYHMDVDSASQALFGWGNGLFLTYFDGSSWTTTGNNFIPFVLWLDPDQPFAAPSGGGGHNQARVFTGY